jgi:hypothetical protein
MRKEEKLQRELFIKNETDVFFDSVNRIIIAQIKTRLLMVRKTNCNIRRLPFSLGSCFIVLG